jgi:hypothetical protein
MKSILIALVFLCAYSWSVQAQSFGLYLSLSDFETAKLCSVADSSCKCLSFRISSFFAHPCLYIRTPNGKQKIRLDRVFAVKDPSGKIFRIAQHQIYEQIDTGLVTLYSRSNIERIAYSTSKGNRYHYKRIEAYYISETKSSPIVPLNWENLNRYFPMDSEIRTKMENLLRPYFTRRSHFNVPSINQIFTQYSKQNL